MSNENTEVGKGTDGSKTRASRRRSRADKRTGQSGTVGTEDGHSGSPAGTSGSGKDDTIVEAIPKPVKPEDATAEQTEKKRGRGRPKGSTNANANRKKKKTDGLGLKDFDTEQGVNTIMVMHQYAAMFLNCPELAVSPQEAENLGVGIAAVARQYDFGLTEKQQAWLTLATAAGFVYGPRLPYVVRSLKARRAQNAQRQPEPEAEAEQPVNDINRRMNEAEIDPSAFKVDFSALDQAA